VWDIDRRYLLAGLVAFLFIAFFAGTKYGNFSREQAGQEIVLSAANTAQTVPEEVTEIQVYVDGEVEKPGLYKLENGARVYEALEMAGILPEGDMQTVQPARKLQDCETVTLYAEGQVPVSAPNHSIGNDKPAAAATAANGSFPSSGLININTASAQELEELPGIGPASAQRIIDYRSGNGAFASIEDINNVSGIGDKKFADLKDLITVR